MRTHFLYCFMLTAGCTIAQVPNGGFESWTDMGPYDDPTNWVTLNYVTTGFGVLTCEQGTPGAPGNYFVKLTTKDIPGLGVYNGSIISGGSLFAPTGFPISFRPEALTGNWQHLELGADSSRILVFFSKWDAGAQTTDYLGAGNVDITGSQTSWQGFSIPIYWDDYWDDTTIPDTATIFMYSSAYLYPEVGSYLYVDDLAFSGNVGVEELNNAGPVINVYPSPANDVLHVDAHDAMSEVSIRTMSGTIVRDQAPWMDQVTMDLTGLDAGAYVVQVRLADGTTLHRRFLKM